MLEFNDVDTTHTDNEIKDISMKRQLTFQELKMNSIGSVSKFQRVFLNYFRLCLARIMCF